MKHSLTEDQRPYDWQDKLIIWSSLTCIVVCIGLMLWWPV